MEREGGRGEVGGLERGMGKKGVEGKDDGG